MPRIASFLPAVLAALFLGPSVAQAQPDAGPDATTDATGPDVTTDAGADAATDADSGETNVVRSDAGCVLAASACALGDTCCQPPGEPSATTCDRNVAEAGLTCGTPGCVAEGQPCGGGVLWCCSGSCNPSGFCTGPGGTYDAGTCVASGATCTLGDTCCDPNEACDDSATPGFQCGPAELPEDPIDAGNPQVTPPPICVVAGASCATGDTCCGSETCGPYASGGDLVCGHLGCTTTGAACATASACCSGECSSGFCGAPSIGETPGTGAGDAAGCACTVRGPHASAAAPSAVGGLLLALGIVVARTRSRSQRARRVSTVSSR